jgi:hypothetical protein
MIISTDEPHQYVLTSLSFSVSTRSSVLKLENNEASHNLYVFLKRLYMLLLVFTGRFHIFIYKMLVMYLTLF